MGTNGNLLSVGTDVNLSIDTQNTIRMAGIVIAIAILFAVAAHFTFKALGRG